MLLPRKHKHARVEMLPLMDVVFLILVFLIYAMMSMVSYRGMPVSLPTSRSLETGQTTALALTIQKDGTIWLDKELLDIESLPGAILRNGREKDPGEPVLQIFADAELPYHKLFSVLDVLKKAGLKKISLQAKPVE